MHRGMGISSVDPFPQDYMLNERVGGAARLRLGDRLPAYTTEIEIVLTAGGHVVERIPLGPNVITNLGRSAMAHLLAGDNSASNAVTSIIFGDGGHNPANPTQPLPPTPTDTALFGNVIITKTTSFLFPDGTGGSKVQFTATVAEDEGNGVAGAQAYSEVGLKNVAGQLLSHKTFGLITKSNAFALTINYTILF